MQIAHLPNDTITNRRGTIRIRIDMNFAQDHSDALWDMSLQADRQHPRLPGVSFSR